MATAEQIVSKIKEYIIKHGSDYSSWYVGITSNLEERLFTEHNVDKKTISVLMIKPILKT